MYRLFSDMAKKNAPGGRQPVDFSFLWLGCGLTRPGSRSSFAEYSPRGRPRHCETRSFAVDEASVVTLIPRNGKPVLRRGRKAMGPLHSSGAQRIARLPKGKE